MFETYDVSRFLGRPVHLFVFRRGPLVWRFASCDRDVTVDGHTYLGAQIKRGEIKQTAERAKDKLTISLAYLRDPNAFAYPVTQSLGDNWFPYTPGQAVTVECLATHFGDTDPPVVEWTGEVLQPRFKDVELELQCVPTRSYDRAYNQGPKWQRACWKTVYSTGVRGCNLGLDAFKVDAELTEVDGLTLTAAEFAAAPINLAGGWIEWEGVSGTQRLTVMRHVGSEITVLSGASELEVGLVVAARPTCEQTWEACAARRADPQNHFGGAVYKPIKNPREGVSMSWG